MPAKVPIFGGFPTFFIFWDHFCESSRTVEKFFDQKVEGGDITINVFDDILTCNVG